MKFTRLLGINCRNQTCNVVLDCVKIAKHHVFVYKSALWYVLVGLALEILLLIKLASSQGSGEPARLHSLTRAFDACMHF